MSADARPEDRVRRRRPPPLPPTHPRWWPTRALVLLMRGVARLPLSWQVGLGAALGAIARRVAPERRQIAATNLALCFPERPVAERDALLHANLRATGIALVETATAWFRDPAELTDRLEVRGREHLDAALADPRGTILVGCHFVTLELCGALLSTLADIDVMYRAHRNPVLDRVQREGRARRYGAVIDRGDVRTAVRRLRDGRALWYAADQDYGPKNAVFVPFFGVPAATLTATARLARMTGARVLRIDHWRREDPLRWVIRFDAPLEDFPSGDDEHDATRLSQKVEDAVAEHPQQYLWVHRRFKTRPPGLDAPYPKRRRRRG